MYHKRDEIRKNFCGGTADIGRQFVNSSRHGSPSVGTLKAPGYSQNNHSMMAHLKAGTDRDIIKDACHLDSISSRQHSAVVPAVQNQLDTSHLTLGDIRRPQPPFADCGAPPLLHCPNCHCPPPFRRVLLFAFTPLSMFVPQSR